MGHNRIYFVICFSESQKGSNQHLNQTSIVWRKINFLSSSTEEENSYRIGMSEQILTGIHFWVDYHFKYFREGCLTDLSSIWIIGQVIAVSQIYGLC